MFKKLISNLPFNPSLINQLSFYAKRIHRESNVRRTGFILLILAMLVQIFAVVSPPQATLARSNNDLINGGFQNRNEAVLHCLNTSEDYAMILSNYGITCSDVSSASTVTLHSTDFSRSLFSMGRLSYGIAGEQPVNISGANNGTSLWLRYLWGWDRQGLPSAYQALSGTTKSGLHFFILFNCGNLVFIGIPKPPVKCQFNPDILASSPSCVEPCPISGKSNLPKNSPKCVAPCPYNSGIAVNSAQCFKPCQFNNAIPYTSNSCKPCEQSQTRDDKNSCLVRHKSASNITQHIVNANGTTARSGDIIDYKLTIINNGKATVTKYLIQENISDVLDYSDVTDLHGGKIDKNDNVSWPLIDIGSKKTIEKHITVRIKSPIPATPTSTSDRGHFDMVMTNVYGDTVNINLPPEITKTTEQIVTTLPNTGPGTSIVVGFVLTSIVGYFFARSRLMSKELYAIKKEYSTTGGV